MPIFAISDANHGPNANTADSASTWEPSERAMRTASPASHDVIAACWIVVAPYVSANARCARMAASVGLEGADFAVSHAQIGISRSHLARRQHLQRQVVSDRCGLRAGDDLAVLAAGEQ